MAGLYTPAIEVPASTPVIETHTAPKASERTGEPAEPRPLLEAHGQAAEPDQTSYAAKESRLKFVFFRNRIRSCNSHELYLAVSKSRGSGTLDTVQRSPPPEFMDVQSVYQRYDYVTAAQDLVRTGVREALCKINNLQDPC